MTAREAVAEFSVARLSAFIDEYFGDAPPALDHIGGGHSKQTFFVTTDCAKDAVQKSRLALTCRRRCHLSENPTTDIYASSAQPRRHESALRYEEIEHVLPQSYRWRRSDIADLNR